LVTEYADYDFKNWQTLEALEDVFWENSFSTFAQDEYLNTKDRVAKSQYFAPQDEIFNTLDRQTKFQFNKSNTPSALSTKNQFNALAPLSDETIPLSPSIKLRDYRLFVTEPVVDSFEDSYESLKSLNLGYKQNYNYLTNIDSYRLNPTSYTQVLDAFRADTDDVSWSSNSLNEQSFTNLNNLNTVNSMDDRVSNPLKLRSTAKKFDGYV
jgi:hypothetical protein